MMIDNSPSYEWRPDNYQDANYLLAERLKKYVLISHHCSFYYPCLTAQPKIMAKKPVLLKKINLFVPLFSVGIKMVG